MTTLVEHSEAQPTSTKMTRVSALAKKAEQFEKKVQKKTIGTWFIG